MKILYLTTHLNVGGITSYLLSLAKGMKKRGHSVYIAAAGGELAHSFTKEGIPYISLPIKTKLEVHPKILISLFKLLRYIKEQDVEIIHSNTRVTQVLGCLIQRFCGRPHISTCHGFFKPKFSRKIFPCWGDKVIAISQEVKEHLHKDLGVSEEKIRVVYNGIDLEKFQIPNPKSQLEIKKKFGLGEGPVIGIIARLSDVKGHAYLIQGMPVVLGKVPQAQLLIIGEGREEPKLKDLSAKLGIEKNVFFLPSAYNTAEALEAMDLFVMPSLKEGLGLGLMEAMASGLAVIGSEVGGIKSLIKDGYNGLLVEPKDSSVLSSAILKLLKDQSLRVFLGNNARNFIHQNFSQDKMVLETERAYRECVKIKS